MDYNPSSAYRQVAAQGVSPVGLVIQSYEQIADALYSAGRAIEAHDIEKKTAELNRAIALVGHLQNAFHQFAGTAPGLVRKLRHKLKIKNRGPPKVSRFTRPP